MIDKILVSVDGVEKEVALGMLTVLTHQGEANIKITDHRVAEITPEDTLMMARNIPQSLWVEWREAKKFVSMWTTVWNDTPPPKVLAEANHAMRHTVGLFALVGAALRRGKVPFVRLPETYLHPKQQAGLADLFSKLTQGGFDAPENSVPPKEAA